MAGMPAAPLSWAAAQVSQVAALAGGWPDHVTAKMLRSVDTDNEMFVQYRGVISIFAAADATAVTITTAMGSISACANLAAALPVAAQAAFVVQWLRRTRQPARLITFYDVDDNVTEIARRAGSESERLAPGTWFATCPPFYHPYVRRIISPSLSAGRKLRNLEPAPCGTL